MTTDLRTLLRTAETVEQRCEAITAAIGHVLPDGPRDSPAYNARVTLYLLVERVRCGDLPPAILLGVVAALVPEDITSYSVETFANDTAEGALWLDEIEPCAKSEARNPEAALALAILDAMEGGNG